MQISQNIFFSQEAARSGNHSINKYEDLLNPVTCIGIVSSYYNKVIGKGDWYTLSEAIRIIQSKNFYSQKEKRLINAIKYVSQCRSLAKAKASFQAGEPLAFKQTLKELADFNINPVTVPREWNIKHIPNFLRTFFDKLLLESAYINNFMQIHVRHMDILTISQYSSSALYNSFGFIMLVSIYQIQNRYIFQTSRSVVQHKSCISTISYSEYATFIPLSN